MRRRVLTLAIVCASSLALPAAAHAATSLTPADTLPLANIFTDIGKAIVGGVEFTAEFFSDLFLAIVGGLADMLIPDAWSKKGLEILKWVVALPNFTASAFKDLKTISQTSLWIGLVMLATTLPVSLSLPSLGLTSSGDTIGAVVGRTAGAAIMVVLWPHLWATGAAIANSVSAAFLSLPVAEKGMKAYMELIAGGVLAGSATGANFIGVALVLFAACFFLAGLVLKVFLLLLGGLIFAGGPILLGLAPTARGAHLVRTAATAVLMTWLLPTVWGLTFIISGAFISSAQAIGQAIGGGGLGGTGGMLIAGGAAIVGPALCIVLSRAMLGPLGSQFAAATSAVSPSRLTQKLSGGARAAAGKAGTVGGGVGKAAASSTAAGGPLGAVQRLMQARMGAAQAVRSGASSVLAGRSAGGAGTAGRAAMGSGLLGVTGYQAGRLAKRGQLAVAGAGGKRAAAVAVAGTPARVAKAPARAADRKHATNAKAVRAMRPTQGNARTQAQAPRGAAPKERAGAPAGAGSGEPTRGPSPTPNAPRSNAATPPTSGGGHRPTRPPDGRAADAGRRPNNGGAAPASRPPAPRTQQRPASRPAPRPGPSPRAPRTRTNRER